MTRLFTRTLLAALVLVTGCGGGDGGGPGTDTGTALFLHHSTGGVVWDGGVESWLNTTNIAQGTSYVINQVNYPDDPYPWENYPYDYWNLWVSHAGSSRFEGQETLDMLAPRYDLIIFKHCFPVSQIEADSGPDIASSTKSLENYKLQYAALKTKLGSFTGKKFLVWTGAVMTQTQLAGDLGSTEAATAAAARTREFFTWVKDEWDEAGDNIFVFDFYALETAGQGDTFVEMNAADPTDSHPSAAFAETVAPRFGQRVVDVLEGRGDTGSLTGE